MQSDRKGNAPVVRHGRAPGTNSIPVVKGWGCKRIFLFPRKDHISNSVLNFQEGSVQTPARLLSLPGTNGETKAVADTNGRISEQRRNDGACLSAPLLKASSASPQTEVIEITVLGTIVNALAIIVGSLVGLFFNKGIAENYKQIVLQGVGLSVVLIGWKSALSADNLLVVIISIVVGALVGEWLKIESKLEWLGQFLENKVVARSSDTSSFARGFVTASLVFCVGSMAIVGSLESGLTGNHQTLFAKAVLDGVISVIFASAMGLGVLFSSVAVLLYQGLITVAAVFLKQYLVATTIQQMTAVGGLLIVAIGINMLGILKIRVGNMLPAIFLPLLYYAVFRWVP
jgi:uncharacterized membrane protein YqgA involved in biofilm formation